MRFLIWGGGGHGRVLADLIRSLGGELVGFIDADPAKLGQTVEPGGGRVVVDQPGFLEQLRQSPKLPFEASAVALGIGDNLSRNHRRLEAPGVAMPCLIHPSAVVSPSAKLGRATVIFARAVVNAGAALGHGVIVNTGAIVEHDCLVGDDAHLSPGALLSGGVQVGMFSWIGAGAVVIQGVKIGRQAMVGAGAVVIRDVPDGATVVGNPARVIRQKPIF